MADLPSIVEYSVDLNDQEAPEPLPAGPYLGIIRSSEKKTSAKGTSYAEVYFFIEAAQYPADFTEGNPEGMSLAYRRCGLEDNPQARFNTKRFIQAIGAPLGRTIDVNDWLGLEGMLDIVHEEYEGINRAVIKSVRAV